MHPPCCYSDINQFYNVWQFLLRIIINSWKCYFFILDTPRILNYFINVSHWYKYKTKLSILFIILLTVTAIDRIFAQNVDDLYLMSEEFPPYNFELNGRLQGISIDLMVLCLDKLGSRQTRQDIRILPWARSYKMLLEEEKTVLFAITRTPQRENLFKWVGPISSSKNVLFARKNSLISLSSPDDIKKYRTGAIRDDAGEQLLQDLFGLDREGIELTSSALSSLLQLKTGRIDLFAYDENVLHWIMTQEGLNPEDFESVYVLSEGFHYFGFHRDTDDELIEQFQKALDDLKDEGLYDIVLKRYQ